MSNRKESYYELEKIFEQYVTLENVIDILMWDSAVIMPTKGDKDRSIQVSDIKNNASNLLRSDKVDKLIKQSEDSNLDNWQEANLREMKRLYENATMIDSILEAELTKATLQCEIIWRDAKNNNDFNLLKPSLRNVIGLTKEVAEIKSSKLGVSRYEGLIADFDSSVSTESIDKMFNNIESNLVPLLPNILNKQNHIIDDSSLTKIPINKQKKLVKQIMEILTFDFSRGRCDESEHPFCRGTRSDTRVTVKYDENNFLNSIMAAIHETGHGVYSILLNI